MHCIKVQKLVDKILRRRSPSISLIKVNDADVLYTLARITKTLLGYKEHNVIFVLTNRPVDAVLDMLDSHGLEVLNAIRDKRLIFIDCLTRPTGGVLTKHALYVSSPGDLSELELTIERAIKMLVSKGKRIWLILDGLATLLLFNGAPCLLQFLVFTVSRLRALNSYGVILFYNSELERPLEGVLRQYVDEIFEL